MSGGRKNSKDNAEGGFGLGAAVLLGAGAAAVGFLARDLWNSYQEFQGQSSNSNGPRPPRPPNSTSANSTSDWENKTDKKLGARKKQRDAFRDQNVPEEMKCVICYENPREVCIVPCRHVCLCEDCAEKIQKICPVCQQRIESIKAVYM